MPSPDDVLSAEVALQQLNETESMIDFRTNRLVDLREPRLQFSDAMLQEYIIADIRSLEGKLIKEFWKQLCTKRKVPADEVTSTFYNYPSIKKWLTVVGVSDNLKEKLTDNDGISVESLLKMTSSDLQDILEENDANKEDRRKLPDAITQLKKCQDSGGKSDEQMCWDSWNKDTKIPLNEENSPNISVDYNENLHPPSTNAQKESTSTCNSDMHALSPPSPLYSSRSSLSSGGPPSPTRHKMYGVSSSNGVPLTPPITSSDNTSLHFQHAFQSQLAEFTNSRSQASTPQPSRNTKIQTNQRKQPLNSVSNNLMLPSFSPLRSSKSTEWQVGSHIAPLGCPESLTASNQSLSSINTLPPPTSSNSKLFSSHKKHKKRPENLDLTRDANDVNFIDLIRPNPTGGRRKSFTISPESSSSMGVSSSPLSPRTPVTPGTPHNTDMWVKQQSISSSIPSYPQTPKTPKGIRGLIKGAFSKIGRRAKMRRNKSEEIVAGSRDVTKKVRSQTDPAISVYGNRMNRGHLSSVSSDRNYSSAQSTTSINSITHSTIDLQSSRNDLHPKPVIPCHDNLENEDMKFSAVTGNSTPADRSCNSSMTGEATGTAEAGSSTGDEHSMEEMDPEEEALIARQNLMRQGSTMSTMQEEWDIPYESLQFEELIGCGRVGKVWRGKWHGEVAIRVIEIGHNDEEKLRAFKHEVMLMKKTRHENIELFMGSCMKPPHLAIVTGFCKGRSLYQHIRQNKDHTVNINNAKIIAQHIAQGMGYLHSRRIIHKDLKSKNIFLDGKRVVITDFGLMGLHTIASKSIISIKPYTLQIPDGWLCYMAPEIIRCLHVPEHGDVIASLPYSKESDVYAFGTVWYELLTGCWPFQDCPAETIIWQVGHGKKQSLGQLQAPKELKEILMRCWSYDASTRPDFSDNGVMGLLIKLPIAKIIRRLSQPTGGRRGRGGHDRFLDLPSLQASQFGSLHDLAE